MLEQTLVSELQTLDVNLQGHLASRLCRIHYFDIEMRDTHHQKIQVAIGGSSTLHAREVFRKMLSHHSDATRDSDGRTRTQA